MSRRAPSPPPRRGQHAAARKGLKAALARQCRAYAIICVALLADCQSVALPPPPPPPFSPPLPSPPPRLLHEVGSLSCCRGSQLLHIWLLLPIYMLESGEGASAVPQTSFLLQWWRHPGPVSLQGEGKKPNKQKADPSPVIS